MLRWLAGHGAGPDLLLNWGWPRKSNMTFSLTNVASRMERAMAAAARFSRHSARGRVLSLGGS